MYTGEIKIGAVYQSHDPFIMRRVTRVKDEIVNYVYFQNGKVRHSDLSLIEEMFRSFTSHEVLPDDLGKEIA